MQKKIIEDSPTLSLCALKKASDSLRTINIEFSNPRVLEWVLRLDGVEGEGEDKEVG